MDNISKRVNRFIALLTSLAMVAGPQIAWALPAGETVINGTVSFATTPTTMTVTQSTDKAIINYDSFSIGAPETVTFVQPAATSIALNRVTGVDPSQISGTLSANGRIFLVNPNGVLFGLGAGVDTNGLIASTLDIANADFLADNFSFSGAAGGVIQNLGELNSPGGFVALLGGRIENLGLIQANLGEIALASGDAVTVSLDPSGIVSVVVTSATTSNPGAFTDAIINHGVIKANQGKVILSAEILGGLFDHAINNQGVIEASQIGLSDGSVTLQAAGGHTVIDGTVTTGALASSNTTGNTTISGNITTTSAAGAVVSSSGDITHNYLSAVLTNDGLFKGNAGQDYIIKNGSLIDAGSGTIDIYAARNVIIGSTTELVDEYSYDWAYIGGDRGGQFLEFGYYYNPGASTQILLSSGFDIGKDGVSPTFGSGILTGGIPDGLYSKVIALGNHQWFTDPLLNSDGGDHYHETGNVYPLEDQPFSVSDLDFQDIIVRFNTSTTSYTGVPAIRTTGNMFITARDGFIVENKSDISAGNLTLNADDGISGHGVNGGFVADTNNLSALNRTSGTLKFEDPDDAVIADLSALTGLNPGVVGPNGLTNNATGEDTDLKAGNDLIIEAPVNVFGDLFLTAGRDIIQRLSGDVHVNQPVNDPLVPPVNVHSTTHTPGIVSNPSHDITAQWQLPDADPSAYELIANAGRDYLQQDSVEANTHGGNATITANNNVALTLVNTQLGAATITALNGSIIDADLSTAPSDYDVIANTIKLSAPLGTIGGVSPAEIDLGAPLLDFSYLWNQLPSGTPDATIDPYTSFLDAVNKWVYEMTFTAPADTTDWWFHVRTVEPIISALSSIVDLGPFLFDVSIPPVTPPVEPPVVPPTAGVSSSDAFGEFQQLYPAYYEILDPNQVSGFEPIQPVGFYAYHPIAASDRTAIDQIELDEGAFEFIENQIKKKDQ